jgi:hypothetical protein
LKDSCSEVGKERNIHRRKATNRDSRKGDTENTHRKMHAVIEKTNILQIKNEEGGML